ncbi:MAG: hypothetical protein ACLPQS_03445 [Acidimicrobiales bacterium]
MQNRLKMIGRLAVGGLALTGTLLATEMGAGARVNKTSAPTISSFKANPATVPSKGGVVDLTAKTGNARWCRFTSSPKLTGLPVDVSCSSGTGTKKVTIPANGTYYAITYTFTVEASHHTLNTSKSTTVTLAAKSGIPTIRGFVTSSR